MSAYICDLDHIAYLVQAGTARELGMHRCGMSWYWNGTRTRLPAGNLEAAQRLGQLLWDENVASVQCRYSSRPIDAEHYPETTETFPHFDLTQVLMSCDCYEYQSCEHDGWETSEAKAYIDALRNRAWHSLPNYDNGVWGAPKREATVHP